MIMSHQRLLHILVLLNCQYTQLSPCKSLHYYSSLEYSHQYWRHSFDQSTQHRSYNCTTPMCPARTVNQNHSNTRRGLKAYSTWSVNTDTRGCYAFINVCFAILPCPARIAIAGVTIHQILRQVKLRHFEGTGKAETCVYTSFPTLFLWSWLCISSYNLF